MKTSLQSFLNPLDACFQLYRRFWPVLLLAACLVMAAMTFRDYLRSTSIFGVGVRSDSVEYLWTAENLAKGLGIGRLNGLGEFKPITHWPPFYPTMLAGFQVTGIPVLDAARWLGAVLDALLILLAGLSAARMTRSLGFSLAAALLLYYSPGFWNISLDAMTEPLFLMLGITGALLLDVYIQGERKRYFILSSLCFGLAALTRYAGAAFIITALIILLVKKLVSAGKSGWRSFKSFQTAALASLGFGGLAVLPVGIWMVRNLLLAGSATNRYINIIPIPPGDYDLLRETVYKWISPYQVALNIGTGKLAIITPAVLLFLAGWWLSKRQTQSARPGLPVASLSRSGNHSILPYYFSLFILVYPAFILLSRLFFDSLITIYEERILYPMYIAALLLILFAAKWLLEKAQSRLGWAGGLAGAVLVVIYVSTAGTFIKQYTDPRFRIMDDCRTLGRGYNSPGYIQRVINQQVKNLDRASLLYTDNLEQLYFLTGRYSFQLNALDSETLDQINTLGSNRPVAFILFYSKIKDEILSAFPGTRVVYSGVDGSILSKPK